MQRIGNFTLDRVVESEVPLIAPADFFPESTPDVFEQHKGWLQPHHVCPDTGKLVICVQSYVVRTGRTTILVDACVGNDKPRAVFPAWNHAQFPYLAALKAAGVTPEDIDVVMCTHLHTDHVGWNTRLVDGRWVPTFPNARYVFGRTEYETWEAEMRRDASAGHGQAFQDSVLPVMDAGRAVLVDSDHELEHGVWLEPAPGHTPGNVVVNLRSGDATAILSGDVIHHPVQLVRPEWSSRACGDRPQSRATRRALLERVADTGTLLAPAHFATPSLGHVVSHGDAFRYRFA
jgi:glyoxylase-like metal-dependent hydrolase (beta-lactamase superfamily II)